MAIAIPRAFYGRANGTTPVVLVAAPTGSTTERAIRSIRVFNSDTAPVTVKIYVDDGSNQIEQFKDTLGPGEAMLEGGAGSEIITLVAGASLVAVMSAVPATTHPAISVAYLDRQ